MVTFDFMRSRNGMFYRPIAEISEYWQPEATTTTVIDSLIMNNNRKRGPKISEGF